MKAHVKSILLEEIDAGFDLYSPSWPEESSWLGESLSAVGLIHPPLLVERDGRFVTVCGLRRVRAAIRLGLGTIECRVAETGGLPEEDLLALNMEDNLSVRELTLFEKTRFVKLAMSFSEPAREKLWDGFASRLELSGSDLAIKRYLALEGLPRAVKGFIDEKRLPLRFASLISDLGRSDAVRLVSLAEKHRLSAATAAEAAEMIREVMLRDGKTFEEIAAAIEDGLDETRSRPGGKREILLERLRKIRFPSWKEKEREMKKHLGAINAVQGVTVNPPPFFEGEDFRAEMRFRSSSELRDRARALERFAESPDAKKAIELVCGGFRAD